MKLFDEIKPVFFIDNKMNDILNDINVKLKKINVNDKQKRKFTSDNDVFLYTKLPLPSQQPLIYSHFIKFKLLMIKNIERNK